jgi:tRNA dimethylallyltransferase
MSDSEAQIIVILGPTASGKTQLAVSLAKKIGAEIISADSRQIYRNMNIGTGKDLEEYEIDGLKIPYHLIDILEAGEKYNLAQFNLDFEQSLEKIKTNKKKPIVCGGSGLYIQSIIKGYGHLVVPENNDLRNELELKADKELVEIFKKYNSLFQYDLSTRKRIIRAIEIEAYKQLNPNQILINKPKQNFIIFGLNPATHTRRLKISERLKRRLFDENMVQEAKNLIERGLSHDILQFYGLEYKYLSYYLKEKLSFEEMHKKLETEIHRFAKRQMTFFRSMEKRGIQIDWIPDNLNLDEKVNYIENACKRVYIKF